MTTTTTTAAATSTTTANSSLSKPTQKKGSTTRSSSSSSGVVHSTIEEEGNAKIHVGSGLPTDRGDAAGTLEAMTVKELKAMMREAGIPSKGSKQDLVSALVSFLRTSDLGEGTVSAVKQPVSRATSSKRKVKASSCEVIVGTKQRKPRGNPHLGDDDSNSNYHSGSLTEEATKRSRISKKGFEVETKPVESVAGEPWTVLTHKKPQSGWIAYNPKVMRPSPLTGDVKSLKLMSWNVNGLRALLKLDGSCPLQLATKENFDVLCLQETKMQEKDVDKIKERFIDGYDNSFWTCSISKLGYSGTAIIARIKPISVRYGLGIVDHDNEGRLVTVEFDNFYLLSGYVPNSGDGLRRLEYRVKEWDPSLSKYMKDLEKSKPVILAGDLNCAHEEIDIYDPAGNRRNAGFTDEERKSFEKNFLSRGFVDTFRRQHPSVVGYSYYGYRHGGRKTNKGWRLDYFLVSESIADKVHDSYILPDVSGSDHCPIGLILKL